MIAGERKTCWATTIAFLGREVGRPPEVRLELEVEADRELVLGDGARNVPGQADAPPAGLIGLADVDPRRAAPGQFGDGETGDAFALEHESILLALSSDPDRAARVPPAGPSRQAERQRDGGRDEQSGFADRPHLSDSQYALLVRDRTRRSGSAPSINGDGGGDEQSGFADRPLMSDAQCALLVWNGTRRSGSDPSIWDGLPPIKDRPAGRRHEEDR